jgi:flagellin-specific chaperone FliS
MLSLKDDFPDLDSPYSCENFSADRHYERQMMLNSVPKPMAADASHILQFGAMVNRNSDIVLSEAKLLLDEWAQGTSSVTIEDEYDFCDTWLKVNRKNEPKIIKEARNIINNSVPKV